jgi:hypothetical protein
MARHHRNLDNWEAERGITMGHTHPPVHHNVPEAGSLATGKAVAKAAAARRSATPRRGRQNIGLPRPTGTLLGATTANMRSHAPGRRSAR